MHLEVLKTYKLYINGKFPRSESGRTFPVVDKEGKTLAQASRASRKDLRMAVEAACKSFTTWQARPAFNRSQIVYRMAEMMESRTDQFVRLIEQPGNSKAAAQKQVCDSIDAMVYYAGWCDKYVQLQSSVNPVSGSFFNFSTPEPMGVVVLEPGETNSLLGAIKMVIPAIAGGNTAVLIAGAGIAREAIALAEVLQTSDLPAGVINVLTGLEDELHPHITGHYDVNAVWYAGSIARHKKQLVEDASLNFKRVVLTPVDGNTNNDLGLEPILRLQETKTTWHPVEPGHGTSGGY